MSYVRCFYLRKWLEKLLFQGICVSPETVVCEGNRQVWWRHLSKWQDSFTGARTSNSLPGDAGDCANSTGFHPARAVAVEYLVLHLLHLMHCKCRSPELLRLRWDTYSASDATSCNQLKLLLDQVI